MLSVLVRLMLKSFLTNTLTKEQGLYVKEVKSMVSVIFCNWIFILFLVSFVLNLYLFDELKNKKLQNKNAYRNRRSGNRFIS